MTAFYSWLKDRLRQPLPGFEAQQKMSRYYKRPSAAEAPETARQSAVLMLLTWQQEQYKIYLIERTQDGGAHSGQIAFPGGKKEHYDLSLQATALREAKEEIGLNEEEVHIIGKLSDLYIPVSNFIVTPIVAFTQAHVRLQKNQAEVEEILLAPLEELFQSKRKTQVSILYPFKGKIDTDAYVLPREKVVWGATAMILSEFEELWYEYFNS